MPETEPWSYRWNVANTPRKGGNQFVVQLVQDLEGTTRGGLKLLKEDSNSERRARLAREVIILQRLGGVPGIPVVLDHNTANHGTKIAPLYVVLEFIDGVSLSEHFQSALSIDDSVRITIQLCEIVRLCHERGVAHRDIKPDNIMVQGGSEKVWLIDFGIGWPEDDADPFETEINQELGNRFLRLPELHSPDATGKRDQRSDLTLVCGVLFCF